jgi:hypothetical protein
MTPPAGPPARAWVVTAAGTAVNLCLGILYAWSPGTAQAPCFFVSSGVRMGPITFDGRLVYGVIVGGRRRPGAGVGG